MILQITFALPIKYVDTIYEIRLLKTPAKPNRVRSQLVRNSRILLG